MSSDEMRLALVRNAFEDVTVQEVKMFGGTAFMVNGHLTVAVSPRGLLVRVGPEKHDEALETPGTRAMEMRGRIMKGYIYVDPMPTRARLIDDWVQSALDHNRTLRPKKPTRRRSAAPTRRTQVQRRLSR